jgi:hypothetical protein
MSGPKITLTVPGEVLVSMHFIAKRLRDSCDPDGPDQVIYEKTRDVARTIEGALRAHGWRPLGDGRWVQ